MKYSKTAKLLGILGIALPLLLVGCKEEAGPAEKAGRELDKAVGQMGEGLKNLGDEVKKSTQ